MSQIMERTLASLPKLLSQSLTGNKFRKPTGASPLSLEVQNFMKCVHRAKSKSQEIKIVTSELAALQLKLKQAGHETSSSFLRAMFSKAIFCHILGYDVNFVIMSAFNLANQGQGYDKHLGYLVTSLLLYPGHQMALLMMCTLTKDLNSANMSDNMLALTTAPHLVDAETLSATTLMSLVVGKLSHSHDLVREKAVHCMRAFYLRSPELLQSSVPQLNTLLSSRDPGVLSAVVSTFLLVCEKTPHCYVSLGPSFLHILQQINHRGFGASYYYHTVPLPWLQISLLKVLGILGSCDTNLSAAIEPILEMLMEKTKVSEQASLAVLVECVYTATKLQGADKLMPLCSRCVGRLLEPQAGPNMRYQGLGLLAALVRLQPALATHHQEAVVTSLQDQDTAVQQRTAQILHAMANRANVKAICSKLLQQINETDDLVYVGDMFEMVAHLADRFSSDIDWYVQTVLHILQHPDNHILGEDFIRIVVSKVEKFCLSSQPSDIPDKDAFFSTLFDSLENPNSRKMVLILSIDLFTTYATKCEVTFDSRRLLAALEKILFLAPEPCLIAQAIVPSITTKEKVNEKSERSEVETLCCACVEGLSRLVLVGCIAQENVMSWLLKFNGQEPAGGNATRYRLLELEDLLLIPCIQPSQGYPDLSSIDFSLSFLDTLVINDILKGGKVHKPQHSQHIQESPSTEVSPLSDLEKSVSTSSDQGAGTSTESTLFDSFQESFYTSKGKWHEDIDSDDDFDQHQEAEADRVMNFFDNKEQTTRLSDELFAGLTSIESTSNATKQQKMMKTIWDDDDDEVGDGVKVTVGGFDLHPFGIPTRKQKSSTKEDASLSSLGLLSQKLSKHQSTTSDPRYDSGTSSMYLDFSEPTSVNNNLPLSKVSPTLGDREPSIYTQSLSTSLLSGSTVDDLTDSEPEVSL